MGSKGRVGHRPANSSEQAVANSVAEDCRRSAAASEAAHVPEIAFSYIRDAPVFNVPAADNSVKKCTMIGTLYAVQTGEDWLNGVNPRIASAFGPIGATRDCDEAAEEIIGRLRRMRPPPIVVDGVAFRHTTDDAVCTPSSCESVGIGDVEVTPKVTVGSHGDGEAEPLKRMTINLLPARQKLCAKEFGTQTVDYEAIKQTHGRDASDISDGPESLSASVLHDATAASYGDDFHEDSFAEAIVDHCGDMNQTSRTMSGSRAVTPSSSVVAQPYPFPYPYELGR